MGKSAACEGDKARADLLFEEAREVVGRDEVVATQRGLDAVARPPPQHVSHQPHHVQRQPQLQPRHVDRQLL